MTDKYKDILLLIGTIIAIGVLFVYIIISTSIMFTILSTIGCISIINLYGEYKVLKKKKWCFHLPFSKRICIFELPATGNSIGTLWKTKRYGNDCELSPFQKPPSDIQGKEFGLKQPIVCFYTLYFNLKFNWIYVNVW